MDDLENDKVKRQRLVLDNVALRCTMSSPVDDFRRIAMTIKNKETLNIENLAGGYTNYTYKVWAGSTALFVKLSFSRAFWNPDPSVFYDVKRTDNEYEIMKRFATISPGHVATPYLCIGLDGMSRKLLVTQWSDADEQLSNQFIDGVVDKRLARTIPEAVAALHKADFDPEFNTNARDCMLSVFPDMEKKLISYVDSKQENRATGLAKEFGKELCTDIFRNCSENYRCREILVHCDFHVFNILVEKKPSIEDISRFGEEGRFVVCDWEMACAGPVGIDMGRLYSFPVACVIAHTINGYTDAATHIISFLEIYWEKYAAQMKVNAKKDEVFLRGSYRNGLAWLGWKLLAMCTFDWFVPFLPIDLKNEACQKILKESLGVMAMKFLRWGFGGYEPNLSLSELRSSFKTTLSEEISVIKTERPIRHVVRRPSALRNSGRRVSDSSVVFHGMSSLSTCDNTNSALHVSY